MEYFCLDGNAHIQELSEKEVSNLHVERLQLWNRSATDAFQHRVGFTKRVYTASWYCFRFSGSKLKLSLTILGQTQIWWVSLSEKFLCHWYEALPGWSYDTQNQEALLLGAGKYVLHQMKWLTEHQCAAGKTSSKELKWWSKMAIFSTIKLSFNSTSTHVEWYSQFDFGFHEFRHCI